MRCLTGCLLSVGFTVNVGGVEDWRFLHAYPSQYVAQKLGSSQEIVVDGMLDDAAWQEVSATQNAWVDLAQLRFPDFVLPTEYTSSVKVRWDAQYLYLGVDLGEPFVTGTVTGHNADLTSSNPIGNVPYYDNDFEFFVDVTGSNYFYKEFEINFLNATYDVLWRSADEGLGSVGVPCCSDNTCARWCQNSSFPWYGGTWSMFPRMTTATAKTSHGWSVEIAFPLYGDAASGGLLDVGEVDGVAADSTLFDPNHGAKYWLVDFSRAEHPFFTSNASNFGVLCPIIQQTQPTLLGDDRWSCYWEWAWQSTGGHQYMHNPDTWGFLQFASDSDDVDCLNVEWPVRYVLAQLYQAEVAYAQETGVYTSDVTSLLDDGYCTIANGCNTTDMRTALSLVDIFTVNVAVDNQATSCVRYAHGGLARNWTGGPCFTATVDVVVSDGSVVGGTIKEDRFLKTYLPAGGALCLTEPLLVV